MVSLSPISNALNPSLNCEEKIKLLNAELDKLVLHFDGKAQKAKTSFQLYKYSSIVLAAVTTIVTTLQAIYTATFPQWILPVVSAGATVMVAFLGASSVQRIWINSRTTGQKLKAEKFLFNQGAGIYHNLPTEESLRLFAERMITLWNDGHGKWEQTVNEG